MNCEAQERPQLTDAAQACLRELAQTYVWWKSPDDAMRFPRRIAAQVMNLGSWPHVVTMIDTVGEEFLRDVLKNSEAGELDARSWHYWHYRLGMAEYGVKPVPPMPVRRIA